MAAASALALTLVQAAILPEQRASAAKLPDFSWLGAVGSLTEEQTAAVAGAVYEGLAAHEKAVYFDLNERNVEFISANLDTMQSVMNVYVTVAAAYDVGILANRSFLNLISGYDASGTENFIGIGVSYLVDDDVYDAEYAEAIAQLDTITSGVDPSWSAPEKALYLHEYMTIHYDYDYEGLANGDELCYTAYSMLEYGKAVCEGYAWLYNILLQRVGIESYIVKSSELNHGWNVLNIDGSWYHVDVTWDDNYDTHPGFTQHTSFLKDRAAMLASGHTSSDWRLTTGQPEEELEVSDKYNDGFWNDLETVIQPYQGRWLAIDTQKTMNWFDLYDFDTTTGKAEAETLTTKSQAWRVWGMADTIYNDSFVIPSVNYGTIYYTTPSSVMAFLDGEHVQVCTLTEEQAELGYIYGLYTEGDTLYYAVSQSINAPAELFSFDLREFRGTIAAEETTAPTETTLPTETAAPETTEATEAATTAAPVPTETIPEATETEAPTEAPATETTVETLPGTEASDTTAEIETETSVALPGDADGDGQLTVQDVILLNRFLLRTLTLDSEQLDRLDVYEDGCVDIFDLTILRRMVLGRL